MHRENSSLGFFSCLSIVMKDATPMTPPVSIRHKMILCHISSCMALLIVNRHTLTLAKTTIIVLETKAFKVSSKIKQ